MESIQKTGNSKEYPSNGAHLEIVKKMEQLIAIDGEGREKIADEK